jgi:Predicted Zn-dependent protease (DUF2268)
MAVRIRVYDHISKFKNLDDVAFAPRVERLKQQLSQLNPIASLTRRTINRGTRELETASDRDFLLQHLVEQNLANVARELLVQLTDKLPPLEGRISCQLVPNWGNRGSGNCFGSDRLLVATPCQGDAVSWLRFVIAHELSHTSRDFGVHRPEIVRECLVFEGLAMVLAETFVTKPGPYPWDHVTSQQEAEYWERVNAEARGLEAYLEHVNDEVAYEIGARIVRSYLQRHNISVIEAHHRSNEELYWNSGYSFIR